MIRRKDPMSIKADKVKDILSEKLNRPFQSRELLIFFSRINRYLRGECMSLTPLELQIKEVLEKNNINSRTAYRWIRTSVLPEEYHLQINKNNLSSTRAAKLYESKENRRKAMLRIQILEMGRTIARRVLQ